MGKNKNKNPELFSVLLKNPSTHARLASLKIGKQEIATPAFMPVGTLANVKAVWNSDLIEMGYEIILANTYHLSLRPGAELIARCGGLKKFMGWPNAVLTDSGGYQVFSLADSLRFHKEGVEFKSHIDGSQHLFTPQLVIEKQRLLASNIVMVLDDCPPANASLERVQESLERTHRWANDSLEKFEQEASNEQHLFGIIQGGLKEELRQISLDFIQDLSYQGSNFDGIAIGGLSVGEERDDLYNILAYLAPRLDPKRPHYLMGVGAIADILEAVKNGVDLFDCVLPTRNARNGQAFTSHGTLQLRNQIHKEADEPLDHNCPCRVCSHYSRAYIRHLFQAKEIMAAMMLSYHNLFFYAQFMAKLRQSIKENKFQAFYKHWKSIFS